MESKQIGSVIEVKYAEKNKLDKACQSALEQIEINYYAQKLEEESMETNL